MNFRQIAVLGLGAAVIGSISLQAQSFGAAKEKVYLQRKLPALAHIKGTTFSVKVSAHKEFAELAPDLESLLETELLKDDPHLSTSSSSASTIITCEITDYTHPRPVVSTQQGVSIGKKSTKPTTSTRVTGTLSVSFQARTSSGQNIASSTATSKYDQTFDTATDIAHIKNSVAGGWKKITGGGSQTDGEDLNPPTDAELRSRLITDVVRQIASHLVNTNETVEAYLAKNKGPIDQGDKEASAGLWQRALETFETAPQNPKPDEDAYRLYNIGLAYEALAYKAEDQKSAMKFLDEAAINYGKAIDAKPGEKYFLEPQKRIETAIAHYKRLEDEEKEAHAASADKPKSTADDATATRPAGRSSKALTNDQVIAMVKSGMDDDTVAQTIRTAKLARFDLSQSGLQSLSSGGVSNQVLKAMKDRAARKTVAQK